MSKDYPLKTFHVKYKGLFDFEALYQYLYDWMNKRKYRTQEKKYKNKPDSPFGFEHEVKMYGTKKYDDFFKYRIDVVMHGRDCAEVEYEGKRLFNGRLEITIEAKVIADYNDKYTGNWFLEKLGEFYMNVIIKREIEFKHWDKLYYRVHGLQEDLKKHLNMYADVNYAN